MKDVERMLKAALCAKQGGLMHNGDSGNYQRHAGVIMYDSAAETGTRVSYAGSSADGHLVRHMS